MAEQARKFGQRLRERRLEVGFEHQKDLVARLHELGDLGINTNQISRYENGEGPLPRESRLELLATALQTDVPDLLTGRRAERKERPAPDLLGANGDLRAIDKRLRRVEEKVDKLLDAVGS